MSGLIEGYYGEAPVDLGVFEPRWDEFMHYLYLPVRLPLHDGGRTSEHIVLPDRLGFLHDAVSLAISNAIAVSDHLGDPYVYVTARRGFATPGNPLNRPGWHCDDFGGTDLNYIWSDRWPTRFVVSDRPLHVDDDDQASMDDMRRHALEAQHRTDDYVRQSQFNGNAERPTLRIEHGPTSHLLRLSPYVIHDTPLIPAPGGMRSFFKISVSSHRYNLLGNSHNYLLDYDWPLYDRATVRNQPGGNGDHYDPEADRADA